MILRRLALFFAMLCAVIAAQVPEYLQQYKQRLEGAIDELTLIVAQFDASAAKDGRSELEGIAKLKDNGDPFIQARGAQFEKIVSRLDRLMQARTALATTGTAGRIVAAVGTFDVRIARRAYESFEPAIPITSDGFVSAIIGFLIGGGLIHLLGWPFRRRHREATPSSERFWMLRGRARGPTHET